MVQACVSGRAFAGGADQWKNTRGAYKIWWTLRPSLYFIRPLHDAAAIKLLRVRTAAENRSAVLIPGGGWECALGRWGFWLWE